MQTTQKATSPTTVREAVEASIEDTEPQDTILAHIRAKWHEKRLNKRLVEELNALCPGWHIYTQTGYSATYLRGWPAGGGPPEERFSLRLAPMDKNAIIDANYIEKANGGWFHALKVRNEARRLLLADPDALAELELIIAQHKDLDARLERLLEGPFEHARGQIKEAFNIRTRGDRR
jgi:hypothetical protein